MNPKILNEILDATTKADFEEAWRTPSGIVDDTWHDLGPLQVLTHAALEQAKPVEDFSGPIKAIFPALDDDELTLEILKLAIANNEAYLTLRKVFIDHKYPQHLDDMGRKIRGILLDLDRG